MRYQFTNPKSTAVQACMYISIIRSTLVETLACSHLGSRNDVAVEVVVDVRGVSRVRRLNMAGDLHRGRQGRRSTSSDLNLSARDVELRRRAWVVDPKLLDSEQVITGSNTAWDGSGVGRYCSCQFIVREVLAGWDGVG